MGYSAASLILALALMLLLANGSSGLLHQKDDSYHRTVRIRVRTACQGNKLTLSCNHGFSLHILAAFYGYTSSKICPGVFKTHLKHPVQCSAPKTLELVRKKCEDKHKCHLQALSTVFGNPCKERVRKYLRVQFTCRFHDCKRVLRLQEKLVRLIARYGKLAKHSHGFWRRRHYKRRQRHLVTKLNLLRRRFHFCFKCKRGCNHLHGLLEKLKSAKTRIKALLTKLMAQGKPTGHGAKRWRTSCKFLKRKLEYLKIRESVLQARLKNCTRICHY